MSRYIDIHTHKREPNCESLHAEGVHPWDAEEKSICEQTLSKAQAIGEIGLDYACQVDRESQQRLFCQQLEVAERFSKVVVLHCVRAYNPTLAILRRYRLRGVIFHGFIGSPQLAEQILSQGYYLSFGANTQRSPKTVAALRAIPLDRLFLETDTSECKIEQIYSMAAKIRGEKVEDIINGIAENYDRLFTQ